MEFPHPHLVLNWSFMYSTNLNGPMLKTVRFGRRILQINYSCKFYSAELVACYNSELFLELSTLSDNR
jgi:hypothetical protein